MLCNYYVWCVYDLLVFCACVVKYLWMYCFLHCLSIVDAVGKYWLWIVLYVIMSCASMALRCACVIHSFLGICRCAVYGLFLHCVCNVYGLCIKFFMLCLWLCYALFLVCLLYCWCCVCISQVSCVLLLVCVCVVYFFLVYKLLLLFMSCSCILMDYVCIVYVFDL